MITLYKLVSYQPNRDPIEIVIGATYKDLKNVVDTYKGISLNCSGGLPKKVSDYRNWVKKKMRNGFVITDDEYNELTLSEFFDFVTHNSRLLSGCFREGEEGSYRDGDGVSLAELNYLIRK